ncbi:MAG: hypothetical protein D6692_12460 [Planctomycetota bacterium]|nr:MAG: hypothetical protein D6692_12460 [Planctomycetota bacterium]
MTLRGRLTIALIALSFSACLIYPDWTISARYRSSSSPLLYLAAGRSWLWEPPTTGTYSAERAAMSGNARDLSYNAARINWATTLLPGGVATGLIVAVTALLARREPL